jgi:uncharacterized protein with von Willebrand factor type A (vWA) domain
MKSSPICFGLLALFLFPGTLAAQEKNLNAYGVLIDNTGSMRSQFDKAREIAKAVVRQIREHGSVAIFDFHSQGTGQRSRALPIERVEATQDGESLNRAINDLYVEGGQTSLLDAVKAIGDSLNTDSGAGNKVVILITDGEERVSEIQQRTLIKFLKDAHLKVFAVGMVEELESDQGLVHASSRQKAVALLNSLTKETGGKVVFPKAKKFDMQNLLTELAVPIQ